MFSAGQNRFSEKYYEIIFAKVFENINSQI